MDLCPACGHDYDLDGQYAGICHYVKGSDPSLGFFRPLCDEGYEYPFNPEVEKALSEMAARLAENMRKTLTDLLEDQSINWTK